ncbi:hypothetical protein [Nesterenkonia sp. K-15-9-6]|uniref:hypothetical protein n=1 Tax=Nesterenkonia sp. K-15-9-6 TaxID=3093918 RepID=UPI004043B413
MGMTQTRGPHGSDVGRSSSGLAAVLVAAVPLILTGCVTLSEPGEHDPDADPDAIAPAEQDPADDGRAPGDDGLTVEALLDVETLETLVPSGRDVPDGYTLEEPNASEDDPDWTWEDWRSQIAGEDVLDDWEASIPDDADPVQEALCTASMAEHRQAILDTIDALEASDAADATGNSWVWETYRGEDGEVIEVTLEGYPAVVGGDLDEAWHQRSVDCWPVINHSQEDPYARHLELDGLLGVAMGSTDEGTEINVTADHGQLWVNYTALSERPGDVDALLTTVQEIHLHILDRLGAHAD